MAKTNTTSDQPPELPWADSDEARIKEIVRLAELRLEDIREFATAADARATAIGVGLSAVSAGLLAAGSALLAVAEVPRVAIVAVLASSTLFIVAACFAIWSARPIAFGGRGYDPKALAGQPVNAVTLSMWTAEAAQMNLDRNRLATLRAARILQNAFFIALAGIVIPAGGLMLFAFLTPQNIPGKISMRPAVGATKFQTPHFISGGSIGAGARVGGGGGGGGGGGAGGGGGGGGVGESVKSASE